MLPIIHVNRYKIANVTLYGSMDEKELFAYFSGFGYHPRVVNYWHHLHEHSLPGDEKVKSFDADMAASLEW